MPIPPEDAYLIADAADRRSALNAAVSMASHRGDVLIGESSRVRSDAHWLRLADDAYRWLRDRDTLHATTIQLVPGKPVKEGTEVSTVFDLSDTDQVVFTLSASDAKGASVPMPADTWSWALADPDATASVLTVSDDTLSATVAAGTPDTTGTLTLTVTGQTTGLTGAEAILVVASAATVIGLEPGTPTAE